MATNLRKFFTWAISPSAGSSPQFLRQVNFVALPPAPQKLSTAQIAEIR